LAISESAQILEESPLLSIENILPFFPDFIVIDTFKAEICASLQEYNNSLVSLKTEMNEYTTTSTDIHSKITKLDGYCFALPADTHCAFSGYPILGKSFNYFSSGFVYCSNVLSDYTVVHCKHSETKNKICGKETEVMCSAEVKNPFDIKCPLTGLSMITSIDIPFHVDFEAAAWDV
jgi:hypothetical protein